MWNVSYPEGRAWKPYKSPLTSQFHNPLDFCRFLLLGRLGKSDPTDSFRFTFELRLSQPGVLSIGGNFRILIQLSIELGGSTERRG